MEKGRPYQECVWLLNSLKIIKPTQPRPRQMFVPLKTCTWAFAWVYENVFFVQTKYQMHEKKWNVVADRRSNVLGGLRRFAVKFCVNKHHNKLTYLRLRFCILIDVPPYQPTRVVIPQPATLSQNPIICSTVTWWRTDKITSLWHHTMCRR